MFLDVLIPISFFISVLLGFYFFVKYRNSERLALIEKGADATLFKNNSPSFSWLKVGILLIGIGLGILVGSLLENIVGNLFGDVSIIFSMLIFGGLAMILATKLDKTQHETDNK